MLNSNSILLIVIQNECLYIFALFLSILLQPFHGDKSGLFSKITIYFDNRTWKFQVNHCFKKTDVYVRRGKRTFIGQSICKSVKSVVSDSCIYCFFFLIILYFIQAVNNYKSNKKYFYLCLYSTAEKGFLRKFFCNRNPPRFVSDTDYILSCYGK